jgi:DNA (cytosine-5)-methyltransferase 1
MDLGLTGGFTFLGRKYKEHPAEIIFANDYDKNACDIYNQNFDVQAICKDIKSISSSEIPPHHILIGGFPCQSFSIVAQNPKRLGYKDEKGRLFFDMVRILNYRKPAVFIAENVKGLLSANNGQALPLIIEEFRKAGYYVTFSVLNAVDFGIPQKRERVFIVGFRDEKIFNEFVFPKGTTIDNYVPLSSVIAPENEIEERFYFSQKAIDGLIKANNGNKDFNKGRIQNINNPSNTVSTHLAKVSINSFDPVLKINGRYRMYTPREVARIQSFPENYLLNSSKTQLYRALGNAVPPVLMWYVADNVFKAIKKSKKILLDKKPYRTKKETRSFNMSQIRGKDTKIEILLRKKLWSLGFRYRVSPSNIVGKPDIAFISKKIAVFCDSSFWHGKDLETQIKRIKTNKEYWDKKLNKNVKRDQIVNDELTKKGWTVLRFWDTEIKDNIENVIEKILLEIKYKSEI